MLGSSSSPFGQSSSSPFGSLSEFGQTCSASNNPFAPMPFGFGSQTGSSTFGGTSTAVFGVQTGSSVFGRTSTSVLGMQTAIGGQTVRSIFGGTPSPTGVFGPQTRSSQFGGTSVGGFGTQTAIGGQTGSSIFKGTSTAVFGPQTSSRTSTGVFGSQTRSGTSTGVSGSLTRSGTSTGAQSIIFRSTAAFMDQQCGSSMVAVPYVATRESDGGGKLVSISAMPAYKEKSHKELRWEASEKLESISTMPAYEDKSHEQIRWEYYHQLGDKGASSIFGQTSSPSISSPSSFAPASTNTTSTFNLPPLISNPSSFDPASTSTTFKVNHTAPSAALTVPDDGTSSQMGFNEATPPSVSVPFSSLPIQNNYGQIPATQSPAAVQPVQLVPATNPFGTLPPVPQMSIGCGEMIQYGISSMPVVDKPAAAPVRVSHLLSSRHLTKRRVVRLPARNYNPKNDGPRIPFFIN